jgi:hypothetical protein
MADPRNNDFATGLLMGLLLSGDFDEDGPYADELEFLLRERMGGQWPFPFHHFRRSRRGQRLARVETRVAQLEAQLSKLGPAMGSFAWSLSVGARPDDMDQLVALPVRIYLESVDDNPSELVAAAQAFLKELGFEILVTGDPEPGSFRQKFLGVIKGFFSRKQTQDAIEKGALALELQLLQRPQAEATKTLAEATATLLEQVKDRKGNVCMQVGSLLLVQYKPDGHDNEDPVIVVRTLSPVHLRRLEENQAMLDKPSQILGWLAGIAGGGRVLPSPE